MKKVLWLASWFPSEERPLNGDFIERHAKAVSMYVPVHVIHVTRLHKPESTRGSLRKEYTSYPSLSSEVFGYRLKRFMGLDIAISYFYSLFLYIKRVNLFIKEQGKPDLINVHVTLRCGLVALYFRWFHRIDFVVSEQYGSLMNEARAHGSSVGFFERKLTGLVLKRAGFVTTVSGALRSALIKDFGLRSVYVIPNVVDTSIFRLNKRQDIANDVKIFLHVSTLHPVKNFDKILRAFEIVEHSYKLPFIFKVISPVTESYREMAQRYGIDKKILWLPETDQRGVAAEIQQSDALILFSSYESFGCVNIEANALGKPVIVSDIPTFREYLKDGINAAFVPLDDVESLAKTIAAFIEGKYTFDQQLIAASANGFSFATVGKMFFELYKGQSAPNKYQD